MCFDLRASVASYLMGLAAGIAALYTRQYILGWLILFYCQIQLAEAIIWYGIDTDSTALNETGTLLLKYFLAAHLIGVGIGIYFSHAIVWPFLVGLAFFLCVCIIYWLNPGEKTTHPGPSGRLEWKFPIWWYVILYMIFIIFMLMFLPTRASKIFIIGAYTLLLGVAMATQAVGSIWCFLSAFAAPAIVLGNYWLTRVN